MLSLLRRRSPDSRHVCAALVVFLHTMTSTVFGHDFWIEPSSYFPKSGETIDVALRVGEHFAGEPVARKPEKIREFVVANAAGSAPISGEDGADPAGKLSLTAQGTHILGYRGNRSFLELDAAKFEAYLLEEGLQEIIARRRDLGEDEKPGREHYSRCAKSVIAVGGRGGQGFDRQIGFTAELVPLGDPTTLKPGDDITVRLLFEGKPLPGAKVAMLSLAEPKSPSSGITDADGKVSFKVRHGGPHMVKNVHMVRTGGDADWESYWSTLTFHVAGPSDMPQRQGK